MKFFGGNDDLITIEGVEKAFYITNGRTKENEECLFHEFITRLVKDGKIKISGSYSELAEYGKTHEASELYRLEHPDMSRVKAMCDMIDIRDNWIIFSHLNGKICKP